MVDIGIAIAIAFATATFIIELHRGIDSTLGKLGALSALGAIATMLVSTVGLVTGTLPILVAGVLVVISLGTTTAEVTKSA